MVQIQRHLRDQVETDLLKKMIFVARPRKVGKTTLALSLRGGRAGCLNWHDAAYRERILVKWIQYREDSEGHDLELCYFRDRDGHEVDFVVVEDRRPVLLVEAKLGDEPPTRGLRYLRAKLPQVDAWQISHSGTRDYVSPEGIRVAPARALLATLV